MYAKTKNNYDKHVSTWLANALSGPGHYSTLGRYQAYTASHSLSSSIAIDGILSVWRLKSIDHVLERPIEHNWAHKREVTIALQNRR